MSRLILFSMYNDWKYINENILNYLSELKKYSDKLICLINHWNIDTEIMNRINNICEIEFVENYWYDFGMYNSHFVTNPMDIKKYDEIVLCNDSVLIVKPLQEVFEWLDSTDKEYVWIQEWYLWQNIIKEYVETKKRLNKEYISIYTDWRHIESWFIQLQWNAKELLVDLITKWIPKSKKEVIMEYEVRRWAIVKDKYTYETYFSPKRYTKKERNKWINYCYEDPVWLLKKWSPFVKKDFRNYWYKRKFKDVINYFCENIYLYNK